MPQDIDFSAPGMSVAPPPEREQKRQKTTADIVQSGASAAQSTASAEATRAKTPEEVRKLRADADTAQAALEEKRNAAATLTRAKLRDSLENANIVLGKLQEARRLISSWSTGYGAPIAVIPETQARALRSILGPEGPVSANILLDTIAKAREASPTGGNPFGQLSTREGKQAAARITSLDLWRKPEEVLKSLDDIERSYRRGLAYAAGQDPEQEDVAKRFGLLPFYQNKNPDLEPTPLPVGGVTGKEEDYSPEGRAGLNKVVKDMLMQGRTSGEIKEYLDTIEPGLGARTQHLEDWEQYLKAPLPLHGIRAAPEVDVERARREKTGAAASVIDAVGDSPVGAYAIGAADQLTAGTIPSFTSNPEATRATMLGSQLEYPGASLAGTIAGGAMQSVGLEGLAARYGLQLSPAMLGAAQAGMYGYGASPNTGGAAVEDAAKSALLGGMLGKAGSAAGRGLGTMATGVRDLPTRYLSEAGVPLTLGEIIGGRAKTIESRLANLPIIGGAIGNRLEEGTNAFNVAGGNEALSSIGGTVGGKTGSEGVREVLRQISQKYEDTLGPIRLAKDEPFNTSMTTLREKILGIPDSGPKVLRALDDSVSDLLSPDKVLTGKEVQATLRRLDRLRNSFRKDELYPSSIKPALDEVTDQVRGLVERQHPDVLPAYDASRAAWRKGMVLADAVRTARKNTTENERGLFTPSELADAGQRNVETFGGRGSSVTGDYPFQQLAEAGQDVMTPRTNRGVLSMLFPIGAGGGAYYATRQMLGHRDPQSGEWVGPDPMTSASLAGGAALMAGLPYSGVAQRGFQRAMLTPRSPAMEKIGDILVRKYAPSMGTGAGAALADYATVGGLPPAGPLPPDNPSSLPSLTELEEMVSKIPQAPANTGLSAVGAPPQDGAPTIPPDARYDPATHSWVLPDGTRIPAPDMVSPVTGR